MPTRRLQNERSSTPSFVKPILSTLQRMRTLDRLRPDQVTEQATQLLHERFGPAREAVEAVFANGCVGLLVDHTHYFDGFGLLLTVPQGVAVAVRRSASSSVRIVTQYEGAVQEASLAPDQEPHGISDPVARIAVDAARGLLGRDTALEVAIVSTLPMGISAGRDAATAVATVRSVVALNAMATRASDRLVEEVNAVETATGAGFSNAYVQACTVKEEMAFVLVDTATLERIALEVPTPNRPGMLLVHTGTGSPVVAHSDEKRRKNTEKALSVLKEGGFPTIDSFRDLMHRDLEKALGIVPRKLRSTVSFLVTENGRVQRAVAAIRRRDWQMFGAIMHMSHAAKQHDWRTTNDRTDFVVSEAEQMSLEGIYGAMQAGENGECAFVVGQPFQVPPFLDQVRIRYEGQFGDTPDALLL